MNTFETRSPFSLVAVLLAVLWTSNEMRAATTTTIVREQPVALISMDEAPARIRMARDDLVSFLQQTLGVSVRRYGVGTDLRKLDETRCIVFGTPHENSALKKLQANGFDVATDSLGEEGCRLQARVIESEKVTRSSGSKLVLMLAGDTLVGASHAVYSLLEKELGIGFFIDGTRVPRLEFVELGGLDRTERPTVPIRSLFYHYVWKHPHANNWRLWGFDGWKTAIDWMRRKRFNLLPMYCDTGGYLWGDLIFKTFPEIPRDDSTLAEFVVDPAWRSELSHKIFAYARESGIQIAYNLFYSQLPEFFATYHPELKYHELNMKNVGINADQPECREIMKKWWSAIIGEFGIDDSHVYLICPYRHEKVMGEGFAGKNSMTIDAFEILKEIDPEAEMFVESWCWKYRDEKVKTRESLDANPAINFREFKSGVPREIGVAEWDVRRMHPMPDSFAGRPHIQLTHTNMENWWPPNTHRNPPDWLVDYFGDAIDHGAKGVMFFQIQADAHEIIADLSSLIGWQYRPKGLAQSSSSREHFHVRDRRFHSSNTSGHD